MSLSARALPPAKPPFWLLFNGSNLTASANGLEWNGETWSLVNHFIPFAEAEVGAPDRFESDFMVQYLADKTLSSEALEVLDIRPSVALTAHRILNRAQERHFSGARSESLAHPPHIQG